jgi:hypothetical protein
LDLSLGIMHLNSKLTGIIIFITFILLSCIYEFHPKEGTYENFLVIYGMVTTDNGPYEVTILKTSKIENINADSVGSANVSISDDKGNSIPLAEVSTGKYHTPETFTGQIGTKYKLHIELQEGKQYESDYVELIDVQGISELRAEHITRQATVTTETEEGYQFYINTEPGNIEQKYYKWDVFEDWEFHMPYYIYLYWDGSSFTRVDIPNACYQNSHIKDILIANTDDFQTNYLTNYPLNFVSKSRKLQFGYGITVRQYALSEFAYKYWKSAIENTSPDPINSKQLYPVPGNLKCISNPDEPVYGIFEASAVKTKSIEVKKLPSENYERYNCSVSGWIRELLAQNLLGWHPDPAYIGIPAGSSNGNWAVIDSKTCVFCEYAGGTAVRPEYWKKNKL